jgi:hypothetical protein
MVEFFFTCTECADHDLRVVRAYMVTTHYEMTLRCVCGEAPDDIAARKRGHVRALYQDWGWLNDAHRVDWEERGVKTETLHDEDACAVVCRTCTERAEEEAWHSVYDGALDEESRDWYLFCGGCDREIAFGWSHPDRGGRLWPVECTDFDPWKCWPEPRYIEAWAAKGWLRPPQDQR